MPSLVSGDDNDDIGIDEDDDADDEDDDAYETVRRPYDGMAMAMAR